MTGPSIIAVSYADEMTCAFCGSFDGCKCMIANQHEGVGSLICESCVNALDAWFTNHQEAKP